MMNLGESQRMSQIADYFFKSGYEIHILGEVYYSFLFKNSKYIFHSLKEDKNIYDKTRYQKFFSFDTDFNFLSDEEISVICNAERAFLQKNIFDAVFTGYRLSIVISCKIEKIPLVWILSGAIQIDEIVDNIQGVIPYHKKTKYQTEKVKNTLKKLINNYSKNVETWNRYLKNHNSETMKNALELFTGDLNLISDYSKFYDIKKSSLKVVGPIIFKPNKKIEKLPILKVQRKKVLLSFGTSSDPNWVQKFVEKLPNDFPYILTTFGEKYNFKDKDVEFVNLIDFKNLKDKIHFAIIHGGQGTVYAMAEQGIPFIGVPMFNEQMWNIKKFSKLGACAFLNKESNLEEIQSSVFNFYKSLQSYANSIEEIRYEIVRESSRSLNNILIEVESFLNERN